jgi:hypothetical protein
VGEPIDDDPGWTAMTRIFADPSLVLCGLTTIREIVQCDYGGYGNRSLLVVCCSSFDPP